jgi:hypothetical protein
MFKVEGVPSAPPAADVLLRFNSAATDAEFGVVLTVAEIRLVAEWVKQVVLFFAAKLDRIMTGLPPDEATHAIRLYTNSAEAYIETRDALLDQAQLEGDGRGGSWASALS